ncbi:MAG: alanine racemase, partial [Flavobacteriales bacterium]
MFTPSYIEIDRAALHKNIKFIRKQVGKKKKISSVIKGNAYGHGIEVMVPLIEETGIDHHSVFHADEALRVSRVCQPETDIMIMGMIDNEELFWAIENDIEFYVFEKDRLKKAIEVAKKM